MIVQTIDISLSKGRAPELLAHLGESNRQIEMIPDVELPESAGAEIDIVKPDGTFAIQTADITDGHIIVTLPDQACTVKGLSHYIMKITDTGTVIYSAYGNIFVDDHLITDAMIESIAEANGYTFPDEFLTDDKLEANPIGSTTDTLYRLRIFDNIYDISGGGGGADVEPNPTGTPTDALNTLRIGNIIYNVRNLMNLSNLADVLIATPTQGQVIKYNPITQKWENGTSRSETVLWSGSETPTTSGTEIQLSDSIRNYNEIVVICGGNGGSWLTHSPYLTSELVINGQYLGTQNESMGPNWFLTSDTTMRITSMSSANRTTYTKIIGIN